MKYFILILFTLSCSHAKPTPTWLAKVSNIGTEEVKIHRTNKVLRELTFNAGPIQCSLLVSSLKKESKIKFTSYATLECITNKTHFSIGASCELINDDVVGNLINSLIINTNKNEAYSITISCDEEV